MSRPDPALVARLSAAIQDFLTSQSWEDTRHVLLDQPVLLTAEGVRFLDGFAAAQADEGADASMLELLEQHQMVLHAARLIGVDVAMAPFLADAEAAPDPYWSACLGLRSLLACDTWDETQQALDQHRALVDPAAARILDQMLAAHHTTEPLPAHAILSECQRFLAECRLAGGTDAALAQAHQEKFLLVPLDLGPVTGAFYRLATADDADSVRIITENPDLVSDSFDAELDTVIGGLMRQDTRFTALLIRIRFVLLRCQEVAPSIALAEAPSLLEPTPTNPIDEALTRLSEAGDQAEVNRIVASEPTILDAEVDIRLGKYIALMRANNHDADVERLTALRSVLAQCRRAGPAGAAAGVAAAQAAADAASAADTAAEAAAAGYPEALQAFIAAPDWTSARAVLEQHPELLADDIDELLTRESARHGGGRRGYELAAYQQLFRQCRALGIGPAFEEMIRAGKVAVELRDGQGTATGDAGDAPGDGTDLDADVARWREQVRLSPWTTTPDGQSGDALQLAQALFRRYLSRSNPADLEEAEALLQSTLAATQDGASARVPLISTLGIVLLERFKQSSAGDDVEQAIALLRQALDESPDPSEQCDHRVNLANALLDRYEAFGENADLREAIRHLDIVVASPVISPDRLFDARHNLGTALVNRYLAEANAADLDRAIQIADEALPELAHRPSRAAGTYSTLSTALRYRYQHTRRQNDLTRSVAAANEAVRRCPGGDSLAMYLSNLGAALLDQYQVTDSANDIEEAISAHNRAIELTPQSSAYFADRLNNLSVALNAEYFRTQQPGDLAKAIDVRRKVVEAASRAGRPPVPLHLDNLALSLRARYQLTGDHQDLDESIALSAEAASRSTGAARRREYCEHLGGALADKWRASRSPADAAQATRAYQEAVSGPAGTATPPGTATGGSLAAARDWCRFAAERARWVEAAGSQVDAGPEAATAVPELWTEAAEAAGHLVGSMSAALREQLCADDKEITLAEIQGAASEAAYVFARAGKLELAVETLENGQSMMLSETLMGNAALDDLSRGGRADLADRYRAISQRLAALGRASSAQQGTPTISDEARVARGLDSARDELDDLVAEIRQLPGYERFLDSTSFDGISVLARDCGILYCASTVHGGLALLVAPGSPGVVAWFFDLSYQDLRELLATERPDGGISGFLAGVLGDPGELAAALPPLLGLLRSMVGRPLAKALAARSVRGCVLIPTGIMRLLPAHAALDGADDQPFRPSGEIDVSYAPSARSLGRAREQVRLLSSRPPRFVGVVDPTGSLRFAGLEMAQVARAFEERQRTVFRDPDVRPEQVINALADATHVHFSCHGVYSPDAPTYSGIVLGAGHRISVSDFRQAGPRMTARLIVASACQTAVTDVARLPDEAIGLPSALLGAGAAAVLGTLWPVDDLSTALLLSHYYACLLPAGSSGEAAEPATALRAAQSWLASLTAADLRQYFEDLLTAVRSLPQPEASDLAEIAAEGRVRFAFEYAEDDRPFCDPVFWAPFVLVGA